MDFQSQKSEESAENKQEEYLAYLCDRAQKLTKAVYRVTDILSDKEPLKWEIREKSVEVFTGTVSVKDKNFLEKISNLNKLEGVIDDLVLLLSLFPEKNSISSVNFEILKDEYLALKKIILQQTGVNIFDDIFVTKEITPPPNGQKPIGQDNGHDNRHYIGQGQSDIVEEKKEKEEPKIEPKINLKSKIKKQSYGRKLNSAMQNRKSKILETIRKKKKVTVGDLSGLFTEISEKTIQRDLLEMVDKGILRKEGDKRWRTYILNDFK
jgi:DNA-binding HxlR family transcriptional regulator